MGIFAKLLNHLFKVPEHQVNSCYFDEESLYGYQPPRVFAGQDTSEGPDVAPTKAKKGRRKPLPQKIREKMKEKKEKQKIAKEQRARRHKDDVQICDVDGHKYLKRLPLPDDPNYEGVYRKLWEDVPDAEQDRQDANYVNAVAAEMNWLMEDEDQMKPRYEVLSLKEFNRLMVKNTDNDFYAVCKGHRDWVAVLERYGDERIAEVFVESREDQEDYPVPWIGGSGQEPEKKSRNRKDKDENVIQKHQAGATQETVQEDEETNDGQANMTNRETGR